MRYAIVGGTGSLGRALVAALLKFPHSEIKVISRCELKQKEMASQVRDDRVSYFLGDIRDADRLAVLFRGTDVVFHVAALKHIDVAEDNAEECMKTNVAGTINVANAAEAAGVQYVVFSSTDKACLPINTYGISKALSEKILLARNKTHYLTGTRFSVFRWGNVLASRGSFLPVLARSVWTGEPVNLTHPDMSRFWIRIEDAVSFMLDNYATAPRDAPLIPHMKAASLMRVIDAISRGVGRKANVHVTGMRAGEKIHEAITAHFGDPALASNTAAQYTDGELDELLRPITEAAVV